MKLLPFIIILIIQLRFTNSQHDEEWFNRITSKTSAFANFVREKAKRIKKFYQDNFGVLKSYIGYGEKRISEDTQVDRLEEQIRWNRQMKGVFDEPSTEYRFERNKEKNNDPSTDFNTPQLIRYYGYPAESHTMVTDDGYILSIHRIPTNNGTDDKRKTVLLHHGLLGSSADWVLMGPSHSLAFILADAGYDVWMANARGNTYSRAHVSRKVNSYEFWNFTWHDISQHDVPTVIAYIMKIKGMDVRINYIGHSMGTSVLFALLSTKPEYNRVLRAGYALAPIAYMSDVKSPIKYITKVSNQIGYWMRILGANEFLPQSRVIRWLSRYMCDLIHYEAVICENIFFIICGYDYKQFNSSMLPMFLSHLPAGSSTKTVIHYAQEIRSGGNFQQFDYGYEGNMKQYGSSVPPKYPLRNITLPIALFSAENDWLAGETDVTNLLVELANPIEHYVVPYKEFNHLDFLFAIEAPKLLYKRVLEVLDEVVNQSRSKYNFV